MRRIERASDVLGAPKEDLLHEAASVYASPKVQIEQPRLKCRLALVVMRWAHGCAWRTPLELW